MNHPGRTVCRQVAQGLVLASCLAALGCSVTLGRKFPAENAPAIVVGTTTEADLQRMFGEPLFQRTLAANDFESTVWGWGYGTSTSAANKGHELHAELADGIVNGFLFASSLEPDSTNFDLSLAGQLHAGRSTLADAEKIFGAPHGRAKVPTNLLIDWFGPMKVVLAPEGATQAIVYCFMDLAMGYEASVRHVRLLVLFAKPDGTINAVRRFDGPR
jgi:hypothetical protein